jgi:hypothetical protein
MSDEQSISPPERTPTEWTNTEGKPKPDNGSHSNPHSISSVYVKESVGAMFLGLISVTLLITLLRTLARNRELEVRLARQERG